MTDAERLTLEQLIAVEVDALIRHVDARVAGGEMTSWRVAFAYAAFQLLATMCLDDADTERIWHQFLSEALGECIHNDIAARQTREVLRGIKEQTRK